MKKRLIEALLATILMTTLLNGQDEYDITLHANNENAYFWDEYNEKAETLGIWALEGDCLMEMDVPQTDGEEDFLGWSADPNASKGDVFAASGFESQTVDLYAVWGKKVDNHLYADADPEYHGDGEEFEFTEDLTTTLHVKVRADDVSQLSYHWFHNEKIIASAEGPVLQTEKIDEGKEDFYEEYVCWVEDQYGNLSRAGFVFDCGTMFGYGDNWDADNEDEDIENERDGDIEDELDDDSNPGETVDIGESVYTAESGVQYSTEPKEGYLKVTFHSNNSAMYLPLFVSDDIDETDPFNDWYWLEEGVEPDDLSTEVAYYFPEGTVLNYGGTEIGFGDQQMIFKGWSKDIHAESAGPVLVDEPLDLYGVWANMYNVSFHANNKDAYFSYAEGDSVLNEYVAEGETIRFGIYKPDGGGQYTFRGWATEPDATEPYSHIYISNSGMIRDLYAVWTPKVEKIISLSVPGAEEGSIGADRTVPFNESITLSVAAKAEDDSELTFYWLKDGSLIEGASQSEYRTEPVLTDAQYSCIVEDQYGNTVYALFYVYVESETKADVEKEQTIVEKEETGAEDQNGEQPVTGIHETEQPVKENNGTKQIVENKPKVSSNTGEHNFVWIILMIMISAGILAGVVRKKH